MGPSSTLGLAAPTRSARRPMADAGGKFLPTRADVFVESGDDLALTIILDEP